MHVIQIAVCDSEDCDLLEAQTVVEADAQDSDIRSNLLELQRSRLYSGKDRKLPLPSPTGGKGGTKTLPHDEF